MHKQERRDHGDRDPDNAVVADADRSRPAPDFDPADYAEEMADLGFTEEQAAAYLRTVWEIMKAFVDLGFGVDSVHRIFPDLNGFSSVSDQDSVDSTEVHSTTTQLKTVPQAGAGSDDS